MGEFNIDGMAEAIASMAQPDVWLAFMKRLALTIFKEISLFIANTPTWVKLIIIALLFIGAVALILRFMRRQNEYLHLRY